VHFLCASVVVVRGLDMDLTPEQRALRSRMAAHKSWAQTTDRTERTRPGREAFMRRFEDQVDPERKLPPAERLRRADQVRQAYFIDLAFRSSRARQRNRPR
jgi:hypothetical protein